MRYGFIFVSTMAFIVANGDAFAQTKAERCAADARDAAQSTPSSTEAARGAAHGAVTGAIFGDAGRSAAIGAVTGGTRKVAQKNRSYQSYYNARMQGRG